MSMTTAMSASVAFSPPAAAANGNEGARLRMALACIGDLPPEIVACILQHLPTADLIAAACVCRVWRLLGVDVLRRRKALDFSDERQRTTDDHLFFVARHLQPLSIDLSGCNLLTSEGISALVDACGDSLTRVAMRGCDVSGSSYRALCRLPKVESVDLSHAAYPLVPARPSFAPTVAEALLHDTTYINDLWQWSRFPSLRRLSISYIQDDFLSKLRADTLTVLEVHRSHFRTPDAIARIGSLRVLALRDVSFAAWPPAARWHPLARILRSCRALTTLAIENVRPSMLGEADIAQWIPCAGARAGNEEGDEGTERDARAPLETLDIGSPCELTDGGLKAIACALGAGLRSLSLHSGNGITDDGIRSLVERCPNLVRLWVPHAHRLTDASAAAIAAHCPSMESLNVALCVRIGPIGLRAIAQNMGSLRELRMRGLHAAAVDRQSLALLRERGCRVTYTAPAAKPLMALVDADARAQVAERLGCPRGSIPKAVCVDASSRRHTCGNRGRTQARRATADGVCAEAAASLAQAIVDAATCEVAMRANCVSVGECERRRGCVAVECSAGCGAILRENQTEDHALVCLRALLPCPLAQYGCNARLDRSQVHSHLDNCPRYRVRCQLCRAYMPRGEYAAHALEHRARAEADALSEAHRCPLWRFGCDRPWATCRSSGAWHSQHKVHALACGRCGRCDLTHVTMPSHGCHVAGYAVALRGLCAADRAAGHTVARDGVESDGWLTAARANAVLGGGVGEPLRVGMQTGLARWRANEIRRLTASLAAPRGGE